jgi:hypothetical protein
VVYFRSEHCSCLLSIHARACVHCVTCVSVPCKPNYLPVKRTQSASFSSAPFVRSGRRIDTQGDTDGAFLVSLGTAAVAIYPGVRRLSVRKSCRARVYKKSGHHMNTGTGRCTPACRCAYGSAALSVWNVRVAQTNERRQKINQAQISWLPVLLTFK